MDSKVLDIKNFIDVPTKISVMDTIINNFYLLRKSKKLSREKLSQISGVDVGVIRRFEESKKITLQNLIHLAFALNVQDAFINLFKEKKVIKLYE